MTRDEAVQVMTAMGLPCIALHGSEHSVVVAGQIFARRLQKLEAVVEAARKVKGWCQPKRGQFLRWMVDADHMDHLAEALAALDEEVGG